MSFDLAIWKRSATTRTAMLAEAYNAICAGGDHPAMAPFELHPLERALEAEFGDYKNTLDSIIVCETGTTPAANWLIIQCAHSNSELVAEKVVPIALKLGLLVYDPQRQAVWGNKRPEKPKKKPTAKKK